MKRRRKPVMPVRELYRAMSDLPFWWRIWCYIITPLILIKIWFSPEWVTNEGGEEEA